ncbi:MAG: two-component sensor histidine kinase, partial [Gammaproteobacteria bacterium]|nr:two-component sensor histidine kinase [Gammaproteobacteria bacterium]
MSSIRRRLLFNLMLLFTVSWLAVTAATYYEARHEIEELFDAQLAQAAGIIADLVLPALETAELRKVELGKRIYGHKYEKHIGFQIWLGEKRAFRSQNVPELNRSRTTGFSDEEIDGETWRVFGFNIEGSDYRIYVGENYQARKELIRHITRDALLLLLWAIPLLAILGWLGIGHGLTPLIRITQEVSNRNPNQLDAIDSTRVPEEIQPLTQSLNALFDRLKEALDTERRFTADAAHELRTPLAGIKTQAQVSLRVTDDDQRTQALENIVQGVDHGTHLVAQMLTLARLEPDAIDQDFQVMDLKEVAEKTVADLVP